MRTALSEAPTQVIPSPRTSPENEKTVVLPPVPHWQVEPRADVSPREAVDASITCDRLLTDPTAQPYAPEPALLHMIKEWGVDSPFAAARIVESPDQTEAVIGIDLKDQFPGGTVIYLSAQRSQGEPYVFDTSILKMTYYDDASRIREATMYEAIVPGA